MHAQFLFTHIGGGVQGSLTTNGPGSYTLIGGGNDIWGSADEFDFAFFGLAGDFDVRARVESLQPTARWSKAGLMARQSTASNSRMAFNRVTPAEVLTSNGGYGANDTRFSYRTGTSSAAQGEHEDGSSYPSYPNAWLRLRRVGNLFQAYRSTDGLNWALQGTQDTSTWEGGAMPASLAVGLAVARHSGPLTTARAEFRQFSNVRADAPVLTQHPSSVTVAPGFPVTFTVDVAGGYDVFSYQWIKNGASIPGGTNRTYTTSFTQAESGAFIGAVVRNAINGRTVSSSNALVRVTNAPIVISALNRGNPNRVYVTFSEPVEAAGALSVTNYRITYSDFTLPVTAAAFDDASQSVVVLTTGTQIQEAIYFLRISNIRDRSTPPQIIVPNPTLRLLLHRPGAFCYSFNSGRPLFTSLFGTAFIDSSGGVSNSGVLKLTVSTNNQQGSFIISDLNFGSPVTHFTATFKALLRPGSAPPADGFSFNFAEDIPDASFGEEGIGNGLTVAFDNFDNGGGEAPAIDVRWRGTTLASRGVGSLLSNSNFMDVRINLDEDGTLDVSYGNVILYSNLPTGYTPIRGGRFGLGGRTGALNETHWIDDLCITVFNPGPVSLLSQPQSRTVNEGQIATFAVRLAGSPPYSLQWFSNNAAIPGASNLTYTTPPTTPAHNGAVYRVQAQNEFSAVSSSNALLTVISDNTPPMMLGAVADPSFRRVTVSFSEPITSASAQTRSNYSIVGPNGPLTILSATLVNGTNVVLTTSPMLENRPYALTVNGVRDVSAAGNLIALNSQISYSSWLIHPGLLLMEYYDNIGPGTAVSGLTSHPKFPNHPDLAHLTNTFATLPNRADTYGARVSGWFIAPATGAAFTPGSHFFYGRGDDLFQLFLSTDSDPANKNLIINGLTCCQPFSANTSALQFLMPGGQYYIEGLMKENLGSDYLHAAVKAGGDPANPDLLSTIPSEMLQTAANPDTAGILVITQQPQAVSAMQNHTTAFSVSAFNSLSRPQFYQWRKLNRRLGDTEPVDIPGANGALYLTPPLSILDNGTEYSVVVSIPGRRVISSSATLLVGFDTTAPRILSIGSINSSLIGVCFDELLDPVSVANQANYVINGGAIPVFAALLRPDGRSVILHVAGGNPDLSVTVNNIRDAAGNLIAPGSSATGRIWASHVDVGFPQLLGSGYSCREGDVDVIAGGADIWGTADQFHFVYQYWENDFDMKVKVQRLEATDSWAKAGLMARQSLDGNSPTIQAYTTPIDWPGAGVFQAARRATFGGNTTEWGSNPASTMPNAWLRLRRQGSAFTAFRGTDGVTWTQFAQTVQPMPSGLFIGMATTSHNSSQSTVAEFRGFQLEQQPLITSQPQSQTVSTGSTVTLQVIVSGLQPFQYQWRLNGVNIPGANSSTLSIKEAQPKDGGRYSVVVVDALGRLEASTTADVVAISPPIAFSDQFGNDQAVISGPSGAGMGKNTDATQEPGEPNHAGKVGGKSVWVLWHAPETGFVTFSSRGSGFDTLLAAYTGSSLSTLIPVASDDDSGSFATSTIRFNVDRGTIYWIAIDGRAGASGNIVLCWNFEFGAPIPEIIAPPTNRSVLLGSSTTFSVVARNADRFQWLFNGNRIANAVDDILQLPRVDVNHVGYYTVQIGNSQSSEIVESAPAYLEIGSTPSRISEDKFEDLFDRLPPRALQAPGLATESSGGGSAVMVAAGTLDSQILNNNNSTTQQGETNHCGTLGSATRWYALQASNDTSGFTFVIDTVGSAINTILAVYTGNSIFNLTNIACAKGPGSSSRVEFTARAGTIYSVAVDGVNGAQGTVKLNWKLGRVPAITIQPTNQAAIPGTNVSFVCVANGVPMPRFQWRSNDVNIANATNGTLTLNNVQAQQAQTYSVLVSNFMGVLPSADAKLTVGYPFTLGFEKVTASRTDALRLLLPSNNLATHLYVIQGTTNFSNWIGLRTNLQPAALTNFVDPDRTIFPYRFYRLVPLGQ